MFASRMNRPALIALAFLLLCARSGLAAPARANPVLSWRADIPLPGPAVRFDYQSIDPSTSRLYISHMDAGELVVFDLRSGRVERTLGGLPHVTGVLAVPALGKVYASIP